MGRILIIRGGAVGDFILTLPSLRLLRKSLPDNEIEILGYPSIAYLALSADLADRVRPLEDPKLATFFAPGASLDSDWTAYFASFDLVVSYLYDPDDYFSENLRLCGVETLINCPYRPIETPPFVPAAFQLAKPLESLGLYLDDAEHALPYSSIHNTTDDGSISPANSLPSNQNSLIALHPGSGSPKKNWGFENWVEVLSHLHREKNDRRFLITSGEAESDTIDAFLHLLDERSLPYEHLAGRPLHELAMRYQTIGGFLGHDSGLSHLAASAGAKALLLFGPTEPSIWAPVSPHVRVLRGENQTLSAIPHTEVARHASELFTV